MSSDRRSVFVREITRWTNAQRAADQPAGNSAQSRELIAATDGIARLTLLRHAAIAALRRYNLEHPAAEVAPALIVLVCFLADNDDGAATASVETLARILGRSPRSITRAIGTLCDGGIITREQRSGASSRLAPVIAPAIARDPAAPVAWWTEVEREPLTPLSPLTVASGVTDEAATPDVTEREPLTLPSPNITKDIARLTLPLSRAGVGENEVGDKRSGAPPLRLASGWDAKAVESIEALGAGPLNALFSDVCATLQPPVGVDGAAWITLASARLGGHGDAVLAALAERIIDERKRDVPPVSDLIGWVAEISAALDALNPCGAAPSGSQACLTIRDGDPSWGEMIAHAQAHLGEAAARALLARGTMQATARWPRPGVVIFSPLVPVAEPSGAAA